MNVPSNRWILFFSSFLCCYPFLKESGKGSSVGRQACWFHAKRKGKKRKRQKPGRLREPAPKGGRGRKVPSELQEVWLLLLWASWYRRQQEIDMVAVEQTRGKERDRSLAKYYPPSSSSTSLARTVVAGVPPDFQARRLRSSTSSVPSILAKVPGWVVFVTTYVGPPCSKS